MLAPDGADLTPTTCGAKWIQRNDALVFWNLDELDAVIQHPGQPFSPWKLNTLQKYIVYVYTVYIYI